MLALDSLNQFVGDGAITTKRHASKIEKKKSLIFFTESLYMTLMLSASVKHFFQLN